MRFPAAANVVVQWNRTLLALVQTPGAQPATIQPTRDFAVMSAAVYDAVDAIDPDRPQYLLHLKAPHDASQNAAVAAHGQGVERPPQRTSFGSVPSSLQMMPSITSSAPPPIEARRPSR